MMPIPTTAGERANVERVDAMLSASSTSGILRSGGSIDRATRLNLGSGDDYRAGYLNIDLRADVADLVLDASQRLPFDDGSIDEILALDFLEHHPAFRTQDILAEWRRVLRFGGLLTVKVPNLQALCEALLTHTNPDMIVRNIYGGHRWGPDGAWDAHHTGWTPTTICRDLAIAGFKILGNDLALNMTVKAAKHGDG